MSGGVCPGGFRSGGGGNCLGGGMSGILNDMVDSIKLFLFRQMAVRFDAVRVDCSSFSAASFGS